MEEVKKWLSVKAYASISFVGVINYFLPLLLFFHKRRFVLFLRHLRSVLGKKLLSLEGLINVMAASEKGKSSPTKLSRSEILQCVRVVGTIIKRNSVSLLFDAQLNYS